MSKTKGTIFFCKECGYESAKWIGQCPACKTWNCMVEAPKVKKTLGRSRQDPGKLNLPAYLDDIELDNNDRFTTGLGELDRVLGGGIVEGSLVLIGGDPGIGKSTILLQVCRNLAAKRSNILYISGEESLKQIRMRAERIGRIEGELKFLCETDIDKIDQILYDENPQVAVIDSIQTMYKADIGSAPGSVTQVRECAAQLMQIAKRRSIAIFIVGHVTKDGQVAGPRVLEHMVDAVLYFEGDKSLAYRILRGVKNRFGASNEIGVFEMRAEGLAELKNPSEYMLFGRPKSASGAVVSCLIEGSRPILLEVQALVTPTVFGMPRRTAVGTDLNRVNLLTAVVEKRCRLQMSRYDVYINIAGGMRTNDPALDLPIILSLISSLQDRPIDDKTVIFGEVGLAGEVRAVNMIQHRINEAAKLGFTRCILPKSSLGKLDKKSEIELFGVEGIREALEYI